MPDLMLEFTWYRDPKGYRLIPAKPVPLKPGQSILNAPLGDIRPARIVRKGGQLQSYQPLKIEDLFERFVDLCGSDEGVKKFVETYGPLTHQGIREEGEIIDEVKRQAKEMSEAMRGRIIAMPLNKFNAAIVTDDEGLRLKVWPASLLDALWLQLAQAGRERLRQCRQCGKPFIIGRGNRRADAKFCSDQCRIKFNSLKRSR
jgi:hypothetical protein